MTEPVEPVEAVEAVEAVIPLDYSRVSEEEVARAWKFDEYYFKLAETVRGDKTSNDPKRLGANCYGSKVGAVIVRDERVISTGYNGTPAGFANCLENGCERCRLRHQEREEQVAARERGESYEPKLKSGMALDTCICVHAEANALLAAARFGISVDGATLYTTLNPCFTCLKESMQAGIKRIVYLEKYPATYLPVVADQYVQLVDHLRRGGDQQNEPTMFLFEPFNGKEIIDVNEPGQEPDIGRVDQPGDGSGHR